MSEFNEGGWLVGEPRKMVVNAAEYIFSARDVRKALIAVHLARLNADAWPLPDDALVNWSDDDE